MGDAGRFVLSSNKRNQVAARQQVAYPSARLACANRALPRSYAWVLKIRQKRFGRLDTQMEFNRLVIHHAEQKILGARTVAR